MNPTNVVYITFSGNSQKAKGEALPLVYRLLGKQNIARGLKAKSV